VLRDIDAATDAYAAASGIKCRAGCGQCCLGQNVEARVVELLPMARRLIEADIAYEVHERATSAPGNACVLYRPDPRDATLGRCGQYAERPSICRLFGFAAIRGKAGGRELASCHWHKKLQPEVVAAAQRAIDAGGDVPLFPDFGMRLRALTTMPPLAEMLPINEALARAIEKVALSRR
jgi:Fe-S-cluster containining protein